MVAPPPALATAVVAFGDLTLLPEEEENGMPLIASAAAAAAWSNVGECTIPSPLPLISLPTLLLTSMK